MEPARLVLRAFAERRNGVWQAFCLELCLAAQGETRSEAVERLEAQIQSYVTEAVTVDREHAADLLNRRAPASIWVRFYWLVAADKIRDLFRKDGSGGDNHRLHPVLPLQPAA